MTVVLLAPLSVFAQQHKENLFTIDAQIRTRGEYRNGVLNPRPEGEEPTFFVNERARLSLGYQRDRLQMRLSAQHVGVWGQDPQIDKNGRFILHEAWARLDFSKGLFAQLGRQPLSYDDERLLGGLDWNVAGRFHDALKLGYESKLHKLHLILASIRMMKTVHTEALIMLPERNLIKRCKRFGITVIGLKISLFRCFL